MADLKRIEKTVEELLAQEAVELVDMRYLQEHGRWVLRFYLDKHGGITLEDCERLSGSIGAVLDADEAMTHAYSLEVSSPGVDRIIKKPRDFERFSGHPVKVRLKDPLEGRRKFTGYLKGLDAGEVVLESGSGSIRFPIEAVQEARLDPKISP